MHQATQQGGVVSTSFADSETSAWVESHKGNNTVNGHISYNWGKHAYASSIGLRLK